MKILNATKMTTIADEATAAKTFLSRLIGLTNRKSLEAGEALIISPCRSIHMFFMRFAIDAIFVGKDNHVVGLVRHLKPFRVSPIFFRASFVIEVLSGTIDSSQTAMNDAIELVS